MLTRLSKRWMRCLLIENTPTPQKKNKTKNQPQAYKIGRRGMGMYNEEAREKQSRREKWTIRNQALLIGDNSYHNSASFCTCNI